MSTATDVLSDTELEEAFALELPCGGNLSPNNRPCPEQAAAAMRSTHTCSIGPQDFKCMQCYAEWLLQNADGVCVCPVCGLHMPMDKVYRPL